MCFREVTWRKLSSICCWAQLQRICLRCRSHGRCRWDAWAGKISLEEAMATHSSILAWKIPRTELWAVHKLVGYTVHGVAKSQLRPRPWAHRHRPLRDMDARRQGAEKTRNQDVTRDTLLRSSAVKRRENVCSIMPVGASQVVLVIKNPPANARDLRDAGSIPGSGRFPRGGHGNPLQCSCLENPMDRRALQATVHKVTKSQTWLKWLSTQHIMPGTM